MRRLALLVVIAACGASPRAPTPPTQAPVPRATQTDAPPAPAPDPSATGLWTTVAASWPALAAETSEVLVVAPASTWGNIGTPVPNERYVVRSGTHGPYRPFVAGTPLVIDDAAAHVIKARVASSDRVDVSRVEVSELVVTSVDAVAILDDALARWIAYTAEQQGAIDAALAEADQRSGGRTFGRELVRITNGWAPAWLPGTHELEVVYVRKITRSSTLVERFGGGGCNKYMGKGGPGAPGFPDERGELVACQPPRYVVRQHTRAYSIDVGLVLRYGADGKLVSARPYEPHPVPSAGPF